MYLHGRHGFTLAKAINYILKPLLVIGSNTVVDYFVLLQTSTILFNYSYRDLSVHL